MKDPTIKSVLVIGSGPIVIGQACEFDYSGTQAIKVLKREGLRVILVNSNPATIMTDPEYADATYVEPLTPEFVERILEKERPDAVLPTVGGQTALNLAVALAKRGTLDRLGIRLIGASRRAVEVGEDRQLFKEAMHRIGLEVPRSAVVKSMEEARAAVKQTGIPAIIRPSFTMGGSGGGIARTEAEFEEIVDPRPHDVAGPRGADRGVDPRLEGIRARGHARQGRQLRRDLFDRELRSDGRAHRRLDHRGSRPDPVGSGVSADAERGPGHHPGSRGGNRRFEHSVRHRPRKPAGSSSSR